MQPNQIRTTPGTLPLARPGAPTIANGTAQATVETPTREILGLQAVAGFLASQQVQGPAAAAIGELMTRGSLRTADPGLDVAGLRRTMAALLPAAKALGPVGEAMARTASDILLDADRPADLLDGAGTRTLTAEMLPRHLAETLTRGQPALAKAAEDFLLTGTLSKEAYDGLGSGGVADLAGLLGQHAEELGGGLEPWGRQALADGLGAMQAAAGAPGGYDGFMHAMVANVPEGTRPYFARAAGNRIEAGFDQGLLHARGEASATGTAGADGGVDVGPDGITAHGRAGAFGQADVEGHQDAALDTGMGRAAFHQEADAHVKGDVGVEGTAHLGPNGLDAEGRVGAHGQADIHAETEATFDNALGHSYAKGQVDGHVEGFVGGDGTLHADLEGVQFHGRLGAAVEADSKVQADIGHDFIPGALGANLHGEVYGKAEAGAYVQVDGNVGFDKKGEVEAYVGIDAKAVAAVEAGAKGAGTINLFGFKITAGGYAKAEAGYGVEANAAAGYKDGKFFASGGYGVAAEVGQDQGAFMSVELPDWARGLVNGVAKLPGGQAAIGAAGQAVGAIVNAAHGLK